MEKSQGQGQGRETPGVPELYVEKVALGEATEAERSLVEESPDGARRVAAVRESDAEILARYPVGPAVEQISDRRRAQAAKDPRRRESRLWLVLVVVGINGVLGLLVGLPHLFRQDSDEEIRTKGLAPHLVAFRQHGTQADEVADGATAKAGDSVQLGYVAAGQRYGMVLSIDGRGGVTQHLPQGVAKGATAPLLRQGGQVLLEQAFRLDDAPRFERFFLVSSPDQEFVLDTVLEAARKLAHNSDQAETAALELPAGLKQSSLLLRKE